MNAVSGYIIKPTVPEGAAWRAVHLAGVRRGSRLESGLRTALREAAGEIVTSPPPDAGPVAWSLAVRGTALDGAGGIEAVPAGPGDLVIDAVGTGREFGGAEVWRLETGAGVPLFAPFAFIRAWFCSPYVMSVRLVRRRDGDILGEVVIGTRVRLSDLIDKAAWAAALLAGAAAAGRRLGPCTPHLDQPGGGSAAGLAAGFLRRMHGRWQDRLLSEWWTIGVCERPIESFLRTGTPGKVDWLAPEPGDAYLADPFVLPRTGRIVCEEFPFDSGVGRLVTLGADRGGADTAPLLATPTHLSYPYVWQEDGETYVLPEAGASGEAILYRLEPDGGLAPFSTIGTDCRVIDPTLFAHSGLYWIAYSDGALAEPTNLCLLYADRLQGPWRPHRGNPVKVDVRSSRPGGTPFRHDGRLYRPAQDCSRAYGCAIAINEVLALTPDLYREEPVHFLWPDPGGPLPDGLHTLTQAGPLTVIDGKRMTVRPGHVIRKGLRRFARLAGSGKGGA